MIARAEPLDGLVEDLFARPGGISLALLVQQRGEVIVERYGVQPENIFQPEITVTADTTLTSWSMAKSITHAAVESFLNERLFGPVGMTSATPKFDGAGDFVGSSYVYATARDFARFGELYRHDGVTSDGVRILPVGWSEHARGFSALDPDNGCEYGRHCGCGPSCPAASCVTGTRGSTSWSSPTASWPSCISARHRRTRRQTYAPRCVT